MSDFNISQIKADAMAHKIPTIRSGSEQILLSWAKETNPLTILEFGTAVGVSAINLALATKARVITIEKDTERVEQAKINIEKAGLKSRIEVILGDDSVVAKCLVNAKRKFDFVFLDSAKGQYCRLLPMIIELLNTNGVLVADNVLFRGYVYGDCPRRFKTIAKNLRLFIDSCKNSNCFKDVQIIDVEDGLLVAKKV